MSRILIKNPLTVATMDNREREFSGGHILIENGKISSLDSKPYPHVVEQTIDATGMVALPGFVNTHHHLYQSLTRNIRLMQDAPLFEWLKNHYEIWRELTESAAYVSARTALLELMKSGTTTSADHLYLFPATSEGNLIDAEIKAARELGIRFHPTRGSMTLGRSAGGLPPDDVVQTEARILDDTLRLLDAYHDPAEGSMLRLSLAPCSPFSVTSEQMQRTAALAREHHLHLHTHLAETKDEEKFCLDRHAMRPVAYAKSVDWLTDYTWFAHTVHLNDEEIRQLGDTRVGVAHCAASNMRLGSGVARVKELRQAGARVGLGVDGSASNDSSNMLAEIRNAHQLSHLRERECWLTARDVLSMATRGGAEVLGRDDIGSLEVGKRADVALFSVQGLEYAGSLSDPLASLVFTVRMSPVDHLIINGEHMICNGSSLADEQAIVEEHNRLAAEMLERAMSHTGIDFTSESRRDA